jgi:hypothetical protein
MTKYAQIVDGIINVISFYPDRLWIPELTEEQPNPEHEGETTIVVIEPGRWGEVTAEWAEVPDTVFVGFKKAGDSWIAPETNQELQLVPDSVSARQFRLQLRRAGFIDQVKAWVALQDEETQDAFEYSGTFVSTEPMMMAGFNALGFTQEQKDTFFLAASKL